MKVTIENATPIRVEQVRNYVQDTVSISEEILKRDVYQIDGEKLLSRVAVMAATMDGFDSIFYAIGRMVRDGEYRKAIEQGVAMLQDWLNQADHVETVELVRDTIDTCHRIAGWRDHLEMQVERLVARLATIAESLSTGSAGRIEMQGLCGLVPALMKEHPVERVMLETADQLEAWAVEYL